MVARAQGRDPLCDARRMAAVSQVRQPVTGAFALSVRAFLCADFEQGVVIHGGSFFLNLAYGR